MIEGGDGASGRVDDVDGGVVGGATTTSGRSGAGAVGVPSAADSAPAGPGVGLRPSRRALEMSAAFHLAYLILASMSGRSRAALSESKVRRTSRKLAAARNLRAVFLSAPWRVCGGLVSQQHAHAPCHVPAPVLVVCARKDAEGEVLDVGCGRRLVVHGVVGPQLVLHALEQPEEVKQEVPRIGLLDFERDALLGRIVCTWRRAILGPSGGRAGQCADTDGHVHQ